MIKMSFHTLIDRHALEIMSFDNIEMKQWLLISVERKRQGIPFHSE